VSTIVLDPLIAEAKRRARRRKVLAAAVAVAVAAGIGVLIWTELPSRGTANVSESPGVATGVPAGRLRTVGTVGSSGGVSWVMNGRGLWLTADGGHEWRKVVPPQGTGFIDQQDSHVQFADPQHGWISITESTGYPPNSGSRPVFARTTDGGRTWLPSFPADCHGRCGVAGMDFLDARHGYLIAGAPAVGLPNRLFRTADGGSTWQPVAKMPVLGPITFLDDRVGFAFANSGAPFYFGPPIGTLYRTTDGGRTWSRYDIGGSKSLVEEPIIVGHHVVVVQNGHAPDRGVSLAPGKVYVSADGRNWSGSPVAARVAVQSDFSAVSPDVWAFVSGSDVYRSNVHMTRDAGRHWRTISLPHRGKHHPVWHRQIDLASSKVGWAVLGRRLYGTTDGGLHWRVAGPLKGKPIPVHACSQAQLTVSFWLSPTHRNPPAHLDIANHGRLGCRLSPWPTVVAVEADGSTLRATRINPRSRPVPPVVVGPGGAARAQVEGIDFRRGNPSACPKVVRLRVTPPGGHRATTLGGPWRASFGRNFYFPVCGGLSITPVHG
jgi:photosystem II stability/assembly factor-like uncharacterized protein